MSSPTFSREPVSRRQFIVSTGIGAAAVCILPATLASADRNPPPAPGLPKTYDIAFLEKWFFDGGDGGPLKYTPAEMAQTCDEIGLDLELTLRKAGHITPENAPDQLPAMSAALAARKRRILFVAMDTVRPDEPHWEKALRTARQLGITQYRHRGFKYEPDKPLKAQIANFNSMARVFAAANKEIGIQALYQIHATPVMAGSAAWDLDLILGDIDPKFFGVAFDTRHVMVEQGLSWPNAVKLLAPRIAALCVKSFRWEGDRPVEVPLGRGNVKKQIVDQVVAAHGGPLPVCIHIEYRKLEPVPFGQRASIVESFRADARVLRSWLGLNYQQGGTGKS
jgi:L-ribulose-5-phosphate 3-epimerase